jgi:DNA-directed RNA polymerase specialized sigma24 family protein
MNAQRPKASALCWRSTRDAEFTEFVAARMTAQRRVAYLLCQDWHRADDLVQLAITRLYANWHRASVMDHTEAYVGTILVGEYISDAPPRDQGGGG